MAEHMDPRLSPTDLGAIRFDIARWVRLVFVVVGLTSLLGVGLVGAWTSLEVAVPIAALWAVALIALAQTARRGFPALDATLGRIRAERLEIERMALVARHSKTAVVVTDREGHITWVNQAFTALTGITPAEAVGRRPGLLLQGPDTDRAAVARIRAALRGGEGFREDLINYHRDGRPYWVSIECQPVRDAAGALTGFVAIENETTALVELRERLASQVERSGFALRAARMGVWEWDAATDTFTWDALQCALIGIAPDAFGGRWSDWEARVVEADRAALRGQWAAALRGEQDLATDFRVATLDGLDRWLRTSAYVVRDASGRPTRAIGLSWDVTPAHRLEQERAQERERLDAFARSVPGVVFQLLATEDGGKSFDFISEAALELLGVSPERITAQAATWRTHIHPDDQAFVVASMSEALATHTPWQAQFRVLHPRRGELRLYGSATLIASEEGSATWSGVILDRTHETRALASLERAEALARLGSWSFDVTAGRVEWSRQLYTLLARDPALGPPPVEEALSYYVDADNARLQAAVMGAVTDGTPYTFQLELRAPHDGIRFVDAEGQAVLDASGRVIQLYGTVHDVTARVEREEALAREQRAADNANRAKSDFLANMSHEIRTPMTAILGYAALLDEPGVDEAMVRDSASTIRRNADHLLQLINEILDLSKIEAGQMAIESIPCRPADLVRDAIALFEGRARQKGLHLTARVEPDVPHVVVSDPTRLKQILHNLLGNAIKFTEEGAVTVSVGLEPGRGAGRLVLRVRDSGIGMTPEQLGRLFRPFVQADESTSRRFGGTGLGLTIVRHLAQLLGGDVRVSSTAGVGSVFTVVVDAPASTEQAAEALFASTPVADADDRRPLVGVHVLVAEDGLDNQRLVRLHLERSGARVSVVANGLEAVRFVERPDAAVDAVLMDMQMPELDGYGAAAEIRARGLTLPIIALTAHAMEEDRRKCLAAGCDDYATKPLQPRSLIATLVRHVRSGRARAGESAAPSALRATSVEPLGREGSARDRRSGPVATPSLAPLASGFADDPEMTELVEVFVASMDERLRTIDAALTARDWATLRTIAHQLRGSGGGFGYPQVSAQAARLEDHLVEEAPPATIEADARRLAALCRAVRRGLPPPSLIVPTRISRA
jgi:PAS domain S-box-containing protein